MPPENPTDSLPGNEAYSRRMMKDKPDLICFSHLRWDWVFQRPQHLMTRFARERRVFYFEEPLGGGVREPRLEIRPGDQGVAVVTPRIPDGLSEEQVYRAVRSLLDDLIEDWRIEYFVTWYYTPMMLPISSHLRPAFSVFDCMDELSAFAGAPPALLSREAELLSRVDLVLTGGMSLYQAKQGRHPNVRAFPSSIDQAHFRKARSCGKDPADQASSGRPRIGYHGVLDERLDLDLLARAAELRPGWEWILVGPVCKIDPASLPRRANIHYLGKKDYAELPAYLAGWDIAMMPFALNESTRFISPTKTPEYLAAGKPVVSTPIKDVVDPYGTHGLAHIAEAAEGAEGFVSACEAALAQRGDGAWLKRVDDFLSQMSWDRTWAAMDALVAPSAADRPAVPAASAAGLPARVRPEGWLQGRNGHV